MGRRGMLGGGRRRGGKLRPFGGRKRSLSVVKSGDFFPLCLLPSWPWSWSWKGFPCCRYYKMEYLAKHFFLKCTVTCIFLSKFCSCIFFFPQHPLSLVFSFFYNSSSPPQGGNEAGREELMLKFFLLFFAGKGRTNVWGEGQNYERTFRRRSRREIQEQTLFNDLRHGPCKGNKKIFV